MTTLDDVARLAGVSRMTASNAMRGKAIVKPETAARVRAVAAQLGYRPNLAARQLSSGKSHIIGVTISDFDLIFPAELAACVSDIAQRHDYQTVLQQTRFSSDFEKRMLSSAAMQVCDGTIICWPSGTDAPIVEFGKTHPLVVIDGFGLRGSVDCVFTPCFEGSAAAIRHLHAHGRSRILLLGLWPNGLERLETAPNSAALRLQGAIEALNELSLDCNLAKNVIPCAWNRQAGYETMLRVLSERNDFDAVFCAMDPIAIGAMRALVECGLSVPDDVAVIGFDGLEDGAYTNPGLTSVSVSPQDMAAASLDMLFGRIESDSEVIIKPRSVTVDFHIIERGSAE